MPAQQQLQQTKFFGCQVNAAATPRDPSAQQIKFQVSHAQCVGFGASSAPAQDCPYTGQQLGE